MLFIAKNAQCVQEGDINKYNNIRKSPIGNKQMAYLIGKFYSRYILFFVEIYELQRVSN